MACAGAPPAPNVAAAPPAPFVPSGGCNGPEYRALDFWLGAWDVTGAGGVFDGDNRIEPILGGCALRESWNDASGGQGESLFFYDRALRRWKQVWVTSEGAWKEKVQVDAAAGAVRFQGVLPRPGGGSALDRTTLSPLPGGKVSQKIERSLDGGGTWSSWEGSYAPKTAACATLAHAQLDFWLGDWDATVRARKGPTSEEWSEAAGSNHVRKGDNGCTVFEDFHAAGPQAPWTGRSVSQFAPRPGKWRQTWVDEGNSYLAFTGGQEGADFVLTGEPMAQPDGKTRQMRMVFSDLKPDSFRWRWEGTTDGGKTWRVAIYIDYQRHHPARE